MSDQEQSPAHNECRKKLDTCNASLQEWQAKYMRLSADLENFKKRIAKEQADWAEAAQAKLLVALLTIIDNFDRAMAHQDQDIPEHLASWIDGVGMIYNSLQDFLVDSGVKEVPCKLFDPIYHEALMQVDSDEHESGEIVSVMEKGYMLNDRVLRPAKVSVAK